MNPSTIIPCGNTILLQPEKQAEQTTSGILLTNTARPFIVYTILAVGGGALTPGFTPGQRVLIGAYVGEPYLIDAIEYRLVKTEMILAVISQ